VLIARNPPLLAAWRRVGANRVGMASATVLLAFIGSACSIRCITGYNWKTSRAEGAVCDRGPVVARLAGGAVAHAQRENLLGTVRDPPLRQGNALKWPGQGTVRDYPRLKYGGKHLGEREDEVAADAAFTVLRAVALAFLGWLAVAASPRGSSPGHRPRGPLPSRLWPWEQLLVLEASARDGRKSGVARPASPGTRY
jgi:peptide/nickel transport system permease protein